MVTTKKTTNAKTKAKAKRAKAKDELWQVVENVVAALERVRNQIPGMKVTQRAQVATIHEPGETRDVDVLVEIPAGGRTLSIGIEVKNKTRPIDLVGLGSIISLKEELHLDRFCVVSTSGFAKRAERLAWRKGIETLTMKQFETSSLWAVPPGGMFVRNNQLELTYANFQYPDSVLPEYERTVLPVLQSTDVKSIWVEFSTMSVVLEQVLLSIAFNQHPEGLRDQQLLSVAAEFERHGIRIFAAGKEIPLPDRIVGTIRVHQRVELVDETRFKLGSAEMSTTSFEFMGENRQFTIVSLRQEDGSHQLAVSVGLARPPKTEVAGRPLPK
jgi:hypothetical protein